MKDATTRREELATRIRDYHGVSFDQVLADVEYLRDEGDSVIAGGSLAYGLGNHLSDLDLVIAGETSAHSSRVPLEHFVGSLRVDVWKLSRRLIEETFERGEQALTYPGALHDSFGGFDHETEPKLLHRIAFGVVIAGDGLRPEQGRDYQTIASGMVVRDYAERMRASALVAQLSLRAGRPIAAVVNARRGIEEALNASVAQRGLPFTGDKWLGERVAGEAADLAAIYAPYHYLPDDPGADGAAFVDGARAACTELWGLDLELDALLALSSWRNSDLRLAEIDAERFLLSNRYGAMWAVEEAEAAAWKRLVAAPEEPEQATWRLDECEPDEHNLFLLLHEHGLLDLGWASGVLLADLEGARGVAA